MISLARRPLLGALALLAAGCEGSKRGAGPALKPPSGRARRPEDYLPPGLDVVVRLDLERLRSTSSTALDPVVRKLRSSDRASLLDLLRAKATKLWIGCRGLPSDDRLDAVLVAQGDFVSFDPSQVDGQPWRRLSTAHPGQARFERTGEAQRNAPSLLVIVGGETLALATPLEAPGVRKILDQGPGPSSPSPPADGLLGLAARPEALARAAAGPYPHLASVLGELASIEAVADIELGALRLDLSLGAVDEPGASRLERVLRGWKEALVKEPSGVLTLLADSASVERDGPRSLKLRLRPSGDRARKIIEAVL